MRKAGFFSCFIVDDNFIGNKKAAKELLRRIISAASPRDSAQGQSIQKDTSAGYGAILIWNLFWTLFKDGSLKKVGIIYWRNFVEQRRRYQRGVFGFAQFVNPCVTHWHFYKFTEGTSGSLRLFNSG
jgi:hypothetical protein